MDRDLAAAIAIEFKNSQKVLSAIGDETRQAILMALMQGPQTPGMRVGEIREKTYLSRPTTSMIGSEKTSLPIVLDVVQLILRTIILNMMQLIQRRGCYGDD
ncbi:hypothetical protein J53TS2_15020 [Paenibacillus sp. J53TS2]|jgi:DNA-binding transcriptional ArsR family regulator|uniref:ArsR/SmtB family transcription factor n=1 Tax=Paenibacillus sp. J53TS2 TaxID=2807197 RepID=UPI001B296723|nr:winged helix-turn-helix domain-containing protein [Paenibacillus sp. J53TS2]GIP47911.1 hypothetical protein J53TS2_15020 [Paenibacillus sp. J53TS2]